MVCAARWGGSARRRWCPGASCSPLAGHAPGLGGRTAARPARECGGGSCGRGPAARHHGDVLLARVLGELGHRSRCHGDRVADDGRHEPGGDHAAHPAGAAPPENRGRPGPAGRGVRAARRCSVPGSRVGRHGRHPADAGPLGSIGHAPHAGVDAEHAGHDAGQPDGHPARDDGRDPCLSMAGPGERTCLRREQTARRGRHRGDALQRSGVCWPTAGCR